MSPLQIHADLLDGRHQDEHGQGHHGHEIGQDDSGHRPPDGVAVHRGGEGNPVGHLRDEEREEVEEKEEGFSAEVPPREDVRSRESEDQGQPHDGERHEDRHAEHAAEIEVRPRVLKPFRRESRGEGCSEPPLGEGADHHVADDTEQVQDEPEDEHVQRQIPQPPAHQFDLGGSGAAPPPGPPTALNPRGASQVDWFTVA